MINRIIDSDKRVLFNYALEAYKDIFGEETNIGIHMANRVVRFTPCSVRGVITQPVQDIYNLIHPYEPLTPGDSINITIDTASQNYINEWYSANKKTNDPESIVYKSCKLLCDQDGNVILRILGVNGYVWNFSVVSYNITNYQFDIFVDSK